MKPDIIESFKARLPPAEERDFTLDLIDHRGRYFVRDFFVAHAPGRYGLFVWGISATGASKVVSKPKRGPSGRGAKNGWGPKKAEKVANLLLAARPSHTGGVERCKPGRSCHVGDCSKQLDDDNFEIESPNDHWAFL